MIDDFPQYGDLWLHHSQQEAFLVCHTRDGNAYGQHILLDPDQPTTSEGKAIPIERLQGRYFLADRRDGTVACCCTWCRSWVNVPHTYDAQREVCPGCAGVVHGGAK